MTKSAYAVLFLLSACSRPNEAEQPGNMAAPSSANEGTPAPARLPDNNIAAPAERTPLAEPSGPIDPTSAEAAGQVVQSYGALIEQQRWAEANALWSDPSNAAKFQSQLAQFDEVHLEIGNPGDPEGAAGSIYVTMPVFFYGDLKNGQPARRTADVTLRRVNDVPGSSEKQRQWHIERIDIGGG